LGKGPSSVPFCANGKEEYEKAGKGLYLNHASRCGVLQHTEEREEAAKMKKYSGTSDVKMIVPTQGEQLVHLWVG